MDEAQTAPAAAAQPQLFGLFGTGRSGTTWLGTILDAHPDIAYRFEPFHRAKNDPQLKPLKQRLINGEASDDDLDQLYHRLRQADPLTDKPPFFAKRGMRTTGIEYACRAGQLCKPLRPLFRRLYTPPDWRPVVFKEVGTERLMDAMMSDADLPAVYLVRHPCGMVESVMRGQAKGVMSTGRIDHLESILRDQSPYLYERYAGRFDELTPAEKNALTWRLDVECGYEAIQRSPNGMLVTFEELCDDAHSVVRRICEHFGLTFTDSMQRLLDRMYGLDQTAHSRREVRDPYFTVFRNPHEQRDRWQSQMTDADREAVKQVVADSRPSCELTRSGRF